MECCPNIIGWRPSNWPSNWPFATARESPFSAQYAGVIWDVIDNSPESAELRAPVENTLSAMWSQTVDVMRTDPSWYVPRFMDQDDQLQGALIWANGFQAVMSLRPAAWTALFSDEENNGCLVPIVMLALDERS